MPQKKRRNRSRKAPNVYVQAQREREEIEQRTADAAISSAQDSDDSSASAPPAVAMYERPRASRLTQTTRSDVYAASIPNEIRKMGILTAGVLAALVVFSVLLG